MLAVLQGTTSLYMGTGDAVPGATKIALWSDDVGLICVNEDLSRLYLVSQLDGLTYIRSSKHVRTIDSLAWDFPSATLLFKHSLFMDKLSYFDSYGGVPTNEITSGGTNYVYNIRCRLSDRYLYVLGSTVQYASLSDPTTWVAEYSFSGLTVGSNYAAMSPTEHGNIVCLIWPNGTVVFYDWVAKEEALQRKHLPANQGAWYSPKLGIYIVKLSSTSFSIYSDTTTPYSMSAPTALTPIVRGKSSEIQIRVLGENSDPCEGELVDWSLSGAGALSPLQSITNVDGYASTTYRAPLQITGTASITASVKY